MNFITKDAQITASGQAIKINALASNALNQLFSTNIGPHGTLKMLITPGNDISLTKDGTVICKDVTFTHPLSKLISSSACSLSALTGDGVSTFICLVCEIFACAFNDYNDGVDCRRLADGIQQGMGDVLNFLETKKLPLTRENLVKLAESQLCTKIQGSQAFASMIVEAFEHIKTQRQTVNSSPNDMIEILKMGEGDPEESSLIKGLVLDHGNRHPLMPTLVHNCRILCISLSLEYEKPEINVQFHYSSAQQRDELVASERKFIFDRAKKIAEFAEHLRKNTGQNLVVINDKGIDPISLEVLAQANVLGLRRAKRCNLERLIKICGGNIVTRLDQLKIENLGTCGKITVKTFEDDKYTFIEETPFQGSCTMLIRGNTSYEIERITSALKSTIRNTNAAINGDACLKGGLMLYSAICAFLKRKLESIEYKNIPGYKLLYKSFFNLAKNLIRNRGMDVEEQILLFERNKIQGDDCIDSFHSIYQIITHGCILGINLLMVDDIIKAGKPIKEEDKNQQSA